MLFRSYVVLLLGTAIFILYETAKVNIFYKNKKFKLHQHSWIHGLPFKFKYRKSKLYISILAPLIIGFGIGLLTGFTGIGGGFILIPCMIYLLGMTTISVIGTSLFNITIISLISLFLQITINQNVDFVLAVILIVSSSFGAAIASRIVERLDQENLKVLFGVLLIIIASFLLYELFRTIKTGRKVTFWYGGRSKRELFYVDHFRALEKDYPNFKFYIALSEPLKEDNWKVKDSLDGQGDGFVGFIHQVVIDNYLSKHDSPEDIEVYFCGPPLMNQAVEKMAEDFGVPPENVRFDDFGG